MSNGLRVVSNGIEIVREYPHFFETNSATLGNTSAFVYSIVKTVAAVTEKGLSISAEGAGHVLFIRGELEGGFK